MNFLNSVFKRDKGQKRFYLLPGQGGSAYRRKRRTIFTWSIIVALTLSAILGALMYLFDRPQL